jgi:hypothetical protein
VNDLSHFQDTIMEELETRLMVSSFFHLSLYEYLATGIGKMRKGGMLHGCMYMYKIIRRKIGLGTCY